MHDFDLLEPFRQFNNTTETNPNVQDIREKRVLLREDLGEEDDLPLLHVWRQRNGIDCINQAGSNDTPYGGPGSESVHDSASTNVVNLTSEDAFEQFSQNRNSGPSSVNRAVENANNDNVDRSGSAPGSGNPCNKCILRFRTPRSLAAHIKRCHDLQPWKCTGKSCTYRHEGFLTMEELRVHLWSEHRLFLKTLYLSELYLRAVDRTQASDTTDDGVEELGEQGHVNDASTHSLLPSAETHVDEMVAEPALPPDMGASARVSALRRGLAGRNGQRSGSVASTPRPHPPPNTTTNPAHQNPSRSPIPQSEATVADVVIILETPQGRAYKCSQCGVRYEREYYMLPHIQHHFPSLAACPNSVCDYHDNPFLDERDWQHHVSTKHAGRVQGIFRCPVAECPIPERRTREQSLDRHLWFLHMDEIARLSGLNEGDVGSFTKPNHCPVTICYHHEHPLKSKVDLTDHVDTFHPELAQGVFRIIAETSSRQGLHTVRPVLPQRIVPLGDLGRSPLQNEIVADNEGDLVMFRRNARSVDVDVAAATVTTHHHHQDVGRDVFQQEIEYRVEEAMRETGGLGGLPLVGKTFREGVVVIVDE